MNKSSAFSLIEERKRLFPGRVVSFPSKERKRNLKDNPSRDIAVVVVFDEGLSSVIDETVDIVYDEETPYIITLMGLLAYVKGRNDPILETPIGPEDAAIVDRVDFARIIPIEDYRG